MLLVRALPAGLVHFSTPHQSREPSGRVSMGEEQPSEGDKRGSEQIHLIAAMARGEKAALAALYDQLSGPLYSLACRMLTDAAEAQDLIQDIFLQAWRTAGSYEPNRGSVFSWLATLVRNRAIDRIRMRQRRSELLADAAPDLQPSSLAGNDEAGLNVSQREQADTVRAALSGLPTDQQRAIELAFFSGLTQQEIAARLNEPLGTVKARIRRGLLKLKERLSSRL